MSERRRIETESNKWTNNVWGCRSWWRSKWNLLRQTDFHPPSQC